MDRETEKILMVNQFLYLRVDVKVNATKSWRKIHPRTVKKA